MVHLTMNILSEQMLLGCIMKQSYLNLSKIAFHFVGGKGKSHNLSRINANLWNTLHMWSKFIKTVYYLLNFTHLPLSESYHHLTNLIYWFLIGFALSALQSLATASNIKSKNCICPQFLLNYEKGKYDFFLLKRKLQSFH